MKSKKALQSILTLVLVLAIIIVANILGAFVYTKVDLTEDQRFTMTKATDRLLKKLKKDTSAFSIEILLEGEFPSEFRHLRNATIDLLQIFRERSGMMIDYRTTNPLDGPEEEVQANQRNLFKKGIKGIQINDRRRARAMMVYPEAIVRYGNREEVVHLLELGDGSYQPSDIDPSINFLEYKFARAIQKLKQTSRPRVVLLTGHGELQRPFTNEMEASLFKDYDIARLDLSQVTQIDSAINLMIIPKPTRPFSYDDKFKIDQYVMNGGKIIWMIDGLAMDDDSLRNQERSHIPAPLELELEHMLVDYGARINNNMVSSFDAAGQQIITSQGQKMVNKWFYHPLVYPYLTQKERAETGDNTIDHPIVKNLDFVLTKYTSSIDTTKNLKIKQIPLLRTSKYSKVNFPPFQVSFNVMDPAIDSRAFRAGAQNVAVLLEGTFDSHFRNRVPPDVSRKWQEMGNYPIKSASSPTNMIVISDGDIGRNEFNRAANKALPLGAGLHPEYGPRIFSNQEFIMNCAEYLLDRNGIIGARSREIKLRPLDQERAFAEETKWQLINLALPLVVLTIFGFTFAYLRRRRFGKKRGE